MKRAVKMIFLTSVLLATLLPLYGCWDKRELNTEFFIEGVGLDAVPGSDEIELTIQIARTAPSSSAKSGGGGGGEGQESTFHTMSAKGTDVFSILETLQKDSNHHLFFQQNQIIIIGSELAGKGIFSFLDSFVRNQATRLEVAVVVAENTAKEILSTELDNGMVPSQALNEMIANRTQVASVLGTRIFDIVSKVITNEMEVTIPIVKMTKEKEEKGKLSFEGLAVLKEENMVGRLDEYETTGFTWSMGKVEGGIISIETPEGRAVLNTLHGNSTADPILYTDGHVEMKVDVNAVFSVGEIHGFKDQTAETMNPLFQKEAAQALKEMISASFKKAQSVSSDIFELGRDVHRKYPEQWKQIGQNWDELFSKAGLSVDVEINIIDDGRIDLPISMKEKNIR